MGIKVMGPDPAPGLTQAGPNMAIPFVPPFPDGEAGETMARDTFNTPTGGAIQLDNQQAIPAGIIPAPNRPLPDASSVAPDRSTIPIPFSIMQDGTVNVTADGAAAPITFP